MKILVTGANGQLGDEMRIVAKNSQDKYIFTDICESHIKSVPFLQKLNVAFDQTGTPTYALDLAKTIVDIIENRRCDGKDGIYHYSNEWVCSWYDFTKMIAEYAGHMNCAVQPCHSDEFPSKVKRPSYSVLDKTKIKETLGIEIPYWTDSLKKCINNLKK